MKRAKQSTHATVLIDSPSLTVELDGKRYHLSFTNEDGIFISCEDKLEVTQQSRTGNWLFIK